MDTDNETLTFLHLLQSRWPEILAAAIVIVIVTGLWKGDGTPIYHQFPFAGQGYLRPWLNWSTADRWRLHEIEAEAYGKYSKRDKPWYTTYWGLRFLIMPPRYLRDLRTADRHALNLSKALGDALNIDASAGDIPTANDMEIEVVSKYLNLRIGEIVPLLNEEADYVFARELGELNKWKQFSCFDLSARLVHYISNRILVGPDLCRQADYRATTEALNMSHVIYGAIWNFLPLGPFRRTVYWVFSIPYRFQIRRAMKKYLIPIIEERMAHQQDPNYKRNLDTIQLMVDMPPASPKEVDSFRHAIRILHLHFASTGSTIALLHNCLWQMLQMPECTEPMRAEMGEVLEKYGSWDSRHTLNHLHLLDSFVREVLRLHVPSALVSLRLATQPVTLHDGLLLRPGTKIAFPAQSIHLDPSNYTNPTSFIPFRFSGTGSCNCGSDGLPKDAGRLKAEALDDKYLPFGYGKQACPGRFFALRVVKLVLARLVWEYDIKWAGQAPKSPTSGSMEGFFLPSKKGEVMLKQRGV